MARTKKQVLQASARKQQLHLEAELRAAQEAQVSGSPEKKGKSSKDDGASPNPPSVSKPIIYKPFKTPSVKKAKNVAEQLSAEKVNSDVGVEKKVSSSHQEKKIPVSGSKGHAEECPVTTVGDNKNKICDSVRDLTADNKEEHAGPEVGPVNLRKARLTARKSTNALKKAEAIELLEAFARPDSSPDSSTVAYYSDAESPGKKVLARKHGDVSPAQYIPVSARKTTPSDRQRYVPCKLTARKSISSKQSPAAASAHPVSARKTFPSDRYLPVPMRARKTISATAKKSVRKLLSSDVIVPEPLNTCSEIDFVNVFPSVHEAVITLPKSEQLPVALVCIKDIYKVEEMLAIQDCSDSSRNTAMVKGRSNSHHSPRRSDERPKSPRRSDERPKSPRRSPKGERSRSKNIFEQFQTEIKGDKSPRTKKGTDSIGRKSSSPKVGILSFASAMKKLRSVSEKVDGKKRSANLGDMIPKKRSPKRNSLKVEHSEERTSPDMKPQRPSLKREHSSGSVTVSPKTKPVDPVSKRSEKRTSVKGERSCSVSPEVKSACPVEDGVCLKKGKSTSMDSLKSPDSTTHSLRKSPKSISPRQASGPRRSRSSSPRVKAVNNRTGNIPVVSVGSEEPSSDLALGKEETGDGAQSNCRAVRSFNFMDHCAKEIIKNLAEIATDDSSLDGESMSVSKRSEAVHTSSSPVPGTSSVRQSESNRVKSASLHNLISVKTKGLHDLICKVEGNIKNKNSMFDPVEPMEDEETSDESSLNTSHNSDTFDQLIEQMETETSQTNPKSNVTEDVQESEGDIVPSDVKCGELYRRLVGLVEDKSSPTLQVKTEPTHHASSCDETVSRLSQVSEKGDGKPVSEKADSKLVSEKDDSNKPVSEKDNKTVPTKASPLSDKADGMLLKHLLSKHVPDAAEGSTTPDQTQNLCEVLYNNTIDTKPSISSSEDHQDAPVGKRVPLWRKLYKTKEPSPLYVLTKAEQVTHDGKKSAFISDALENYLETSKSLALKSQMTPLSAKGKSSPDGSTKEIEPDFDEVEGVLFLSFCSKDAMQAHIAVERRNKWDKDANHLLGVSRLLEYEKEKTESETPEKVMKAQNLRGQHMKWKKYRRMLHEEFESLQQAQEIGEDYSTFRQFEKTSDITKIKGWRKKFTETTDADGKLHWKTEEKLIKKLEPDDIRALGFKKKRRKNVVFTHRKGTSKDIGFMSGRTSIYGQTMGPDDTVENWDGVVLGEYEEPLFEDMEEGSVGEGASVLGGPEVEENQSETASILQGAAVESDVKDRPFGYAKLSHMRREFASLFNWGEDELKIMKNLGGRVRNRRKKNDPRDMTSLMDETESLQVKKKRYRIKSTRSDYNPVSIITHTMAIDATCALDFGNYKPTKPGSGLADNILTKFKVLKGSSIAPCRKLVKKAKTANRLFKLAKMADAKAVIPKDSNDRSLSGDLSGSVLERVGVPKACDRRRTVSGDHADGTAKTDPAKADLEKNSGSKRVCDKPGCRYGCICHLCNDPPEEVEPKPQDHQIHACNKEYCRLGCICDSLSSSQEVVPTEHCRKPSCMLRCVCSNSSRRQSTTSPVVPDEGALSEDEIPPLIQDPTISAGDRKADESKSADAKAKEAQTDSSKSKGTKGKTWSRAAKSERFQYLPQRESRHRVSKNLDAITRKALNMYETSEMYCEQSSRARKKQPVEDVALASKPASSSKVKSPNKPSKSLAGGVPSKAGRRKSSSSQLQQPSSGNYVVHISDDEDASCARLSVYNQPRFSDRIPPDDSTVVHIEKQSSDSNTSSLSITPSSSRPGTPAVPPSDLAPNPSSDAQKDKPRAGGELSASKGHIVPLDLITSQWHTQMVCLKANPKPKDPSNPSKDESGSEGGEIKLLEFMANCNWDAAKPQVLSRVAQCLSRGVYPDPKRMVIGEFVVEILPKSDKCAVIPPELRGKLPTAMHSIRVKVMKRATEIDLQRFQMKHCMALDKSKEPCSSQTCDSASKRVFKNWPFMSYTKDMPVSQAASHGASHGTMPTSPQTSAAPSTQTTSSTVGISGLSKLQISRPTAVFMESGGRNTRNIDASPSSADQVAGIGQDLTDDADVEHVTVHDTTTGKSMSMVLEPSESQPKKSRGVNRVRHTSNKSDGTAMSSSAFSKEVTIDLTDESSELKLRFSNKLVSIPKPGRIVRHNSVPTTERFPTSLVMSPTAASGAQMSSAVTVSMKPAAPPNLLVPVACPASGSLTIVTPTPLTTCSQTKLTKTIISTPGGKLYGPFSDLNDVKMLQVKTPDGLTKPLISLLPTNSLPLVNVAKTANIPIVVPISGVAVPGIKPVGTKTVNNGVSTVSEAANPDLKPKRKRKRKSNADGTVIETIEDSPEEKKKPKRKRKKKARPSDEVDGASVTPPQKDPVTSSKIPVQICLANGASIFITPNSDASEQVISRIATEMANTNENTLQDKFSAEKENIDGECNDTAAAHKKFVGSHDKEPPSHSPPAPVSEPEPEPYVGQGGPEGVRPSMSSSIDGSFRTSTPSAGTDKCPVGFVPIKRPRSDSDPAGVSDAEKKLKLSERLSPDALELLKKTQDLAELQYASPSYRRWAELMDEDSQQSFDASSISNNQSEVEELDIEGVSGNAASKLDARDVLYRRYKESLDGEATGDDQGKKVTRNETRRPGKHDATPEKFPGIRVSRERARRQDILCMFMYMYNTITKDNKPGPHFSLSKQKVLDSALATINEEVATHNVLKTDLKLARFYHRAQKQRLKSCIEDLIMKGTPAKVILTELDHIKKKENKSYMRKKLLQSIIDYGRQKNDVANDDKTKKRKYTPRRKRDSPRTETVSQSMAETLKSSPAVRADPQNPSCYWSDNFLIEIENEEVDIPNVQEQITLDGGSRQEQITLDSGDGQGQMITIDSSDGQEQVTINSGDGQEQRTLDSSNGQDEDSYKAVKIIDVDSSSANSSRCENQDPVVSDVIVKVEMYEDISDDDHPDPKADDTCLSGSVTIGGGMSTSQKTGSEANASSRVHARNKATEDPMVRSSGQVLSGLSVRAGQTARGVSGTSHSMQAPQPEDNNNSNLRDKECAKSTLRRSNSEEAIMQVESFIQNAEKWGNVAETDGEASGSKGDKSMTSKQDGARNGENESPKSGKSDDRTFNFETIFPGEINFDDASVDSVPLEAKVPNSVSLTEEVASVSRPESPREVTPIEIAQGNDGAVDGTNADNGNLLICDVRGLAEDAFSCTTTS